MGLPPGAIVDVCVSDGDRLWIARERDLFVLSEYSLRRIRGVEGARKLATAPSGCAYALCDDGLFLVGDDVEPVAVPGEPVESMFAEANGTLWVRAGGRNWRRGEAGWTEVANPEPTRAEPRPAGTPEVVTRVVEIGGTFWGRGRDGSLWRRDPGRRRFDLGDAKRVNALARRGERILCGTENGLAIVAPDGAVERVTELGGRRLGVVTGLAVDARDRIWIGSGSSFTGVFIDGQHHPEIDTNVHRISVDPTGTVWLAGLGGGAWYYVDGKFQPAPANVDLPSARVYDVVTRDPSGTLWFATLEGLAAYAGPDRVRRFDLPGRKVFSLCAARDGSLWVGYQGKHGASHLVRGEVTHFDRRQGLCSGEVWAIVEGRPGVFWFATEDGLGRYDGLRWSCFELGEVPLWPLLADDDGTLWIGTLGEGLVRMTATDTAAPRTVFPRDLITFEGDGPVPVYWESTDSWSDTPRRHLWHRVRIDGARWGDAHGPGKHEFVLDAGEHTIEVQAIDRFGNVESPPARLTVTVVKDSAEPSLLWPGIAAALLAVVLIGLFARRSS